MSSKPTRICKQPNLIIPKDFIPGERVQLWVCLLLYGWSLPRCEGTSLGMFDFLHFHLLGFSPWKPPQPSGVLQPCPSFPCFFVFVRVYLLLVLAGQGGGVSPFIPWFYGVQKESPCQKIQRAANGGSDPSWLNLAFLGRPDFPFRGPQTL